MANKKTFRWRGMVTLVLLMFLLIDAASGIILYFSPSGSAARWSGWAFWGLDRTQWNSIHLVFSLVLLLILAGHLYFNWRLLSHFIWDKMRQSMTLKKELAGAFMITALIFAGTLWHFQPLQAVTDLRESMKRSNHEGYAANQGGRFSGRALGETNDHLSPGKISRGGAYGNNNISNPEQSLGNGRRGGGNGRNANAGSNEPNAAETNRSELKGRDYVNLGKLESYTGTLRKLNNDEWGLQTGDRLLEIHLGPSDYRENKGFLLKEGASATVSGYVYENQLTVQAIESEGQRLALRDENGQPLWSSSSFGRGRGRSGGHSTDGSGNRSGNGGRYYSQSSI